MLPPALLIRFGLSRNKKKKQGLGCATLFLLMGVSALAIPFFQLLKASESVESFCHQTEIGALIDEITPRAKAEELALKPLETPPHGSQLAQGPLLEVSEDWYFGRWACLLTHDGRRVVGKEVNFVE